MSNPSLCQRGPNNSPCGLVKGADFPWGPENCRLCYLVQTDSRFQKKWGGPPLPEPPGTMQRLVNFTGAVLKHLANGLSQVSEEVYQDRLATCQGCEFFTNNRCAVCGCSIAGDVVAKARWNSETCPKGFWKE